MKRFVLYFVCAVLTVSAQNIYDEIGACELNIGNVLEVSLEGQEGVEQVFQQNGDRPERDRRRQLSPQQQGHILSDIQQHQHRFQLHQNYLKTQVQQKPGQVVGIQPSLATEITPQSFQQPFSNLPQTNTQPLAAGDQSQIPDSLLQPQLPLIHQNHQFNSHTNGQPSLLNPQAQFIGQPSNTLNLQPVVPSIATPIQSQLNSQGLLANPTQSTLINRAPVQHHTQTAFKANYVPLQPTSNPVNVITSIPAAANPLFTDNQNSQLTQYFDPEKHQQRLKELRLKQQIIEKHNQFVEKQYEKALKKAQEEHQDWIQKQNEQRKKLYQSLYRPGVPRIVNFASSRPRYIFPEEVPLFKQSIEQYYEEHPTTTTTTTTTTEATTTPKESTLPEEKLDPELSLPNSRQNQFSKVKTTVERQINFNDKQFLPTALPEPKPKPIKSIEQLDLLQKQYQQQLLQREDLLLQLKQAIAETPEEEPTRNFTAREISLPGGQTVQIIKTLDPKLIPGVTPLTSESIASPKILQSLSTQGTSTTTSTTTPKPPTVFLEELTKGVLPPGADFEVIKHTPNGGLEELGNLPSNLPNQKKVTFVLLEEQQDGTYKVQGVRGNAENQKDKESVDVDSILTRIKNGEIKLPPPTRTTTERVRTGPTSNDIKAQSTAYATPTQNPRPAVTFQTTQRPTKQEVIQHIRKINQDPLVAPNLPIITTNIGTQFIPSPTQSSPVPNSVFSFSSKYPSTTPQIYTSPKFVSIQGDDPKPQINHHSTAYYPTSTEQMKVASTASSIQKPVFSTAYGGNVIRANPPAPTQQTSIHQGQPLQTTSEEVKPTAYADEFAFTSPQSNMPLVDILKKKGLFAMAKFLRQSGLDTILNETGPYTIFVPSDKAFRMLLVQLGGPERAEEKFKENPRLLSGLLLHHVIPGAFEIRNLQDEMTGVSLAGTQLRVNQYAMQDLEWNEVKVTTINGAKVIDDRQDIDIPQGVAHAIDRVMFPLPVGDLVQTLQSDRERRFTTFLRILFASGLADTFQGTKTYTVFAPVDRSFSSLTSEQLSQLVSDKSSARDFIMRHIVTGTLYTTGMRYYQLKESLQPDKQIALSKSSGRIKVNNIPIITQNVPATNGVIHAIESLL